MKSRLQAPLATLAAISLAVPVCLPAANVSLTTADAGGSTSFNTAGHWSNALAPSAANDYFTAGYLLRTPTTAAGSSNYFLGNSLSLDFNAGSMIAGLSIKYAGSSSIRVDNLKLNGGAIFNGVGGTMSVYGNITVLTNSYLDPQASGRVLAIYAPITGASSNTIGIRAASGSAGGIVQILGDGSGYSGNWYINGTGDSVPGAILQVGNGGASGSLGPGRVTNNSALWFNRADGFAVNNPISGPGAVVMAGPGVATLSAANSYTGATTVSAGTLALGSGGSIGSSSVISLAAGATLDVSAVAGFGLSAGQTLSGSGTVLGSMTAPAGTTVSPGDTGSGTLTVNGNLNLAGGAWRCDLNTPGVVGGVNDLLVVNGNLTLTPGIAVSLVFPGGTPVVGAYTLCQCTGTLVGDPGYLNAGLGSSNVTFTLNASGSPRSVLVTVSGTNTPPAQTAPPLIKVFLQGGQSNADGRAATNGLPANLVSPQPDVPFYYYLTGGAANGDGTLGTLTTLRPGCSASGGATFGPEVTFGRTLADYFALTNQASASNVMVVILKYAHGGTSLAVNWSPNGLGTTNGEGADYVIFQRVVSAGLSRLAAAYPGATIELDGMIWVQGETDIDNGAATSAAYGTNLVRFIKDVRLTYGASQPYGTNLPFFFSRVSTQQTYYSVPTDSSYANYLVLRAGQAFAATALSNVFMLDIDGAQFSTFAPGLHFDTGGQQAMGRAFAQAVISALPPPTLQPPARLGAGWRLSFAGVSGTSQTLERATALAGPWTRLTNFILGPWGYTNFDDTTAGATAFYRVVRP